MKSLFIFGLLSISLLGTGTVARADVMMTCGSKGFSTSSAGYRLYTDAELQLALGDRPSRDGVLKVWDVQGHVHVGAIDTRPPLSEDNAYFAEFNTHELRSNPFYRPRKYKGYLQFPGLDAASTTGMEAGVGMWGTLLLEKRVRDGMRGKYIFKAGDHAGGVVHLVCHLNNR